MPLLWRNYILAFIPSFLFYVLFLTLLAFIFRFKELLFFLDAHAPLSILGKFLLYNVPFFFTIAAPIAAAISGYLISHRLSQFGEWTALSTLGVSKTALCAAPLLIAFHLFLGVFWLNAETCPHYRGLSKKLLLETIYHHPVLVLKHFRSPHYPMAIASQGDTLLLAGQKETTQPLDLFVVRGLHVDETSTFTAKDLLNIHHTNNEPLLSLYSDLSFDGKQLPFQFHFPKNYEEHLPLSTTLSWTEIARRFSVASLTASLFLLLTVFGVQRNRRAQNTPLFLAIGMAAITYFSYLTLRSSPDASALLYFLCPLLPLPLTVWRFIKELK